ncbi:MAG TPA: glycosyltransferase family 4 protein [Gemmatimonadaceae bacterium]|jgi:glycosyltransferase involved in cell wall biosynthesis
MKIGIISQYYPASYRPGFDTEFAQFVRDGYDIQIYSGGAMGAGADDETIKKFGLVERTKHYPNDARNVPPYLFSILGNVLTRPGYAVRAKSWADDVNVSSKAKVAEWVRMLRMPRRAPDLWLIHNLTSAIAFTWLKKAYPKTPIGLYYHGPEVPKYGTLDPTMVQQVWDESDVVFTNTGWMAQHLIERGVHPNKLRVVPGGFDFGKFPEDRPRTYRPNGTLRLISAGRLSDEKGMAFTLEAVKNVMQSGMTNIHYVIVGEGHLRPQLEQYVRDNGMANHVRFTGTLSSNELFREVADADALLLPSIKWGTFVENQARIVQETLLLKTAVISSDIGGVPESIPDTWRAFSIPPENVPAWTDAIVRFEKIPATELARMGEEARTWVMKHYDIRVINDRLLKMTLGKPDPAPDSRYTKQ